MVTSEEFQISLAFRKGKIGTNTNKKIFLRASSFKIVPQTQYQELASL